MFSTPTFIFVRTYFCLSCTIIKSARSLITSDTDERRKQQLLSISLHTNYHQPLHINPTRKIRRGLDRSNTTPNPTTHNISICAASLKCTVVKGIVCSIPHNGGWTPRAFIFKIGLLSIFLIFIKSARSVLLRGVPTSIDRLQTL